MVVQRQGLIFFLGTHAHFPEKKFFLFFLLLLVVVSGTQRVVRPSVLLP